MCEPVTAAMMIGSALISYKQADDAAKARFWPVEGLLGGHGPIALAFDHLDILSVALDRLDGLGEEEIDDEDDEGTGGKA